MDYHELAKNTVSRLREMAKEHFPDLQGVGAIKKDKLVDMLADKLGIEKPHKVARGIDKSEIKAKIRALKKIRDEAVAAKDRAKLVETRRELHGLRRQLQRAVRLIG